MNPKKIAHKDFHEEVLSSKDKFVQFLVKHGYNALIGTGIIVVLLTAASYFFFKNKASEEKDYFFTQRIFNQFISGNENAFKDLQKSIDKHPDLQAKYNALIAQNLLINKNVDLAQKYLKNTLGEEKLHYKMYSDVSILIAQERYDQALEKAQELNGVLSEQKNSNIHYGNDLFVFNLLRIALLNQILEQQEAELLAWQELKNNTPLSEKILYVFSKDNLSLLDYIAQREKKLKKSS